jgi:hypothetical protein
VLRHGGRTIYGCIIHVAGFIEPAYEIFAFTVPRIAVPGRAQTPSSRSRGIGVSQDPNPQVAPRTWPPLRDSVAEPLACETCALKERLERTIGTLRDYTGKRIHLGYRPGEH